MIPRTVLFHLARSRPAPCFDYPTKFSRLHSGLPKAPLTRASINFHLTVPSRRFNSTQQESDGPRDKNIKFWDTATKTAAVVAVGGTVYYIYHLERAPVTGRWRFMDVSPKHEHLIASQAHQQLLSEFQDKILPPDHLISRHVRRVVGRILEGSQLGRLDDVHVPSVQDSSFSGTPGDTWSDGFATGRQSVESYQNIPKDWKVLVVNDPNVMNAAVVYGTVVVFTGILPLCQDENGLAAVIGHEIAHVVARHQAERLSSMKFLTVLAVMIEALLGIDFQLTRFLTTYTLELPNSRTQELEADRIGLTLTAQACYDPQSVPDMQKRLAKLESTRGMNIALINTHPSSERRAKLLELYLPDAYSAQAASSFCAGMQAQLSAFENAVAYKWKSTSNKPESELSW